MLEQIDGEDPFRVVYATLGHRNEMACPSVYEESSVPARSGKRAHMGGPGELCPTDFFFKLPFCTPEALKSYSPTTINFHLVISPRSFQNSYFSVPVNQGGDIYVSLAGVGGRLVIFGPLMLSIFI